MAGADESGRGSIAGYRLHRQPLLLSCLRLLSAASAAAVVLHSRASATACCESTLSGRILGGSGASPPPALNDTGPDRNHDVNSVPPPRLKLFTVSITVPSHRHRLHSTPLCPPPHSTLHPLQPQVTTSGGTHSATDPEKNI